MLRRLLLEIGVMAATGVNYAGGYIVAFVWDFPAPHTELFLHILMMFFFSVLSGAVIADFRKGILYTIGSIMLGIFLATAIISAPSMLLGESIALVDVSITVALVAITRLFILGVTFQILGIIIGGFIGDAVSE